MTHQTTRSAAFDDALQNAGHALMLPDPVPALARVLAQFRDEHRAEVLAEAAAVSAAVAPPTDQAALRDRIAEVLTEAYLTAPEDSAVMEHCADAVLAVLAVLPSAADRTAEDGAQR